MSKIYNRNIRREIRQSFGRFAAIIAIVALGIGFLVGILSSTPDMKTTASQYYKDQAMSDYDIKSTLGFTEDDIAALKSIPEIQEIMAANVMDAIVYINNDEQTAGRIYGLNMDNITINKLELTKGRMPQDSTECVIETPTTYMEEVSIGDTITISAENEDMDDTYAQTEFTVVGIVENPYYFCSTREPASVGTGCTGVILYTYKDAYKTEVYTDLFLLTGNTYDAFSEEYDDYIDVVTEKIESVSEERIPARYREIINEAMAELQDAKDNLKSEKEKAESQFASAEAKLNKSQQQYENGMAQLKNAQKELDTTKAQLDSVKSDVAAAKEALAAGYPVSDEAIAQIQQYDEGLASWESGTAQVQQKKKQLDAAAQKLSSGRAELRENRSTAEAEFEKAESEISDAEKEIRNIESGQWYILDRNSNASYARFSVDVEKVTDIATIFPIFFFLIAALVALTTMTRMVEEERIQIGTLKALGYRRITIMSKYLIYCGTATVLGCIIGLLMGYRPLPVIIFLCFGSQYTLPPLITPFYMKFAVISCILELICTLGATWAACRHSLKEKTADLMTPRAPKAGKRILLERIGFLWNRISFSHKATFRNIFRYKKHLFMTVLGVAGCTSLMVAGFGIQDSLTKLVNTQYDEILKYDMRIELVENSSDQILNDFLDDKKHLSIMTCSMDIESDENDEIISSTIYVPSESDQLQDFVDLRDRQSGDTVDFHDDSVIITEKMADILNVSPGDTVTLTDPDGVSAKFTLTGITENYAGCYVYISSYVYAEKFGINSSTSDDMGSSLEWNGYLVKSGITGTDAQEATAQHLQESKFVSSTEFTSQSRETYEIIMESLTLLVSVLILFAGMLAAVVLYNLTNININERTRELATLRVLGYHHREVGAYIFREIGILTVMGTIIGLILGKILHYYIIRIAESPDIVFGRELNPSTYILSVLLTLLFSAVVDVIMSFKLKRIEMAASMKAID